MNTIQHVDRFLYSLEVGSFFSVIAILADISSHFLVFRDLIEIHLIEILKPPFDKSYWERAVFGDINSKLFGPIGQFLKLRGNRQSHPRRSVSVLDNFIFALYPY